MLPTVRVYAILTLVALTASELRRNIYRLLDSVLETGIPLDIKRGDQVIRISSLEPPTKLENLPLRNLFSCDPDELVTRETISSPSPGMQPTSPLG